MALGKIDHIDFYVDDLEKAEEYFTKKLGFKLLRRTEHLGKSIELTSPAGDCLLELHQESEEARNKRESFPGGLHFGHIAFKADDINKEFEELKSKGVSFLEDAPTFSPPTGRTLAHILDADGHFWIQLAG